MCHVLDYVVMRLVLVVHSWPSSAEFMKLLVPCAQINIKLALLVTAFALQISIAAFVFSCNYFFTCVLCVLFLKYLQPN